ncbi:hypothetical protein [Actinoplanes couchii]|uniref:hypothetical protein n=1 Tax=Actinoplanes couchii TaxID=403638 RepID=UPI001943EFE0|nr:hypothetical protein [Actinoplanes couchii]
MVLEPVSFYGEQSVLSSVACAGGRVVLLGAKSGGVHGNPRVSSWVGPLGGPVREVSAPFELFGGPDAVNAGRVRTASGKFLIVGNRVSGASVWSSPDGDRFVLRPAAGVSSWASDAVASGDGWLVVGAATRAGARSPAVWSWDETVGWVTRPVDMPGPGELSWAGPVLLGVSAGFRAWRQVDGRWVAGPAIATGRKAGAAEDPGKDGGALDSEEDGGARYGVAGGTVSGAVVSGRVTALTGSDDRYRLWVSADSGVSWAEAALPPGLSRSAVTAATPAGSGDRLTLFWDAGEGARVYTSDSPFGRFK